MGVLRVVERLPSTLRAENDERLARVRADTPDLVQARASAAARNRLLVDRPSPWRSAEFLADPAGLAASLAGEIAALLRGENPYRRRVGDTWRSLVRRGARIPFRLYAPHRAAGDEPLPLLIALHGAGGDENLFFEGYGLGLVTRLADELGFLVAAPHTVRFSTRPEVLDLLLETLSREYAVDPRRVLLLGHSLGALAAGTAARARSGRVAALCLIAGRVLGPEAGLPPTLLVLGGLDPLFPAGRTSPQSAFEVRRYPRFGHTLVVGHALPDAVRWLLRHRR
jgi:poly(3-hydroxybutyrate) depolymerase